MNLKFLLQTGLSLGLLVFTGCGPEAETGAVFSKHSAQASASPSPDDTASANKPFSDTELDYLFGKIDPANHPDFVTIASQYSSKQGMFLRKEAIAAFGRMWAAAKKDGISLTIISATRPFNHQKAIWERKWSKYANTFPDPTARARKILEFSSMPGSSRHHWGTDIDINDLNNSSFEAGGAHSKVYEWLNKHAKEYGYYQPYTPKNDTRPNGYNEERWHWSYLPLAKPLVRQYKEFVSDDMITGFKGANTAQSIGIVKNYVLGISADCL